jgi:hypothetical protein
MRAAVVILLIVVCSALAGAAIERVRVVRHRPGGPGGFGGPGRGSPEQDARRRADMLDRMTKDLGLSAAQRAAIDSVMQHSDSTLRVIRAEMQPRMQKVFEESNSQIEARLDQGQREKFEKSRPRRPRR